MADYTKVSNVAAADIAKVNNVAKADISKVNECTKPSAAGATLWCIVGADGGVSTAAAADLNAWTGYVSDDMGNQDYTSVAYGKDGNGAGLWVITNGNGNREVRYSSDPTAGVAAWSDVNVNADMRGVAWGDDHWVVVGSNGKMWRSPDGDSNWVEVDLSGLAGRTTLQIDEIISDGAGNWMFGQDTRIYVTDDITDTTNGHGSWALAIDLNASGPQIDEDYNVRTLAYTDSKWIVYLEGAGDVSGHTRVYYATDPAGTWTAATIGGATADSDELAHSSSKRMAAGDGTVIIVGAAGTASRSTNSGADWTAYAWTQNPTAQVAGSLASQEDGRDVATDGAGNWVAVHDNGRVSISTDDGVNWVEQTGDQYNGDTRLRFPTGTSNIESLDAASSNVLLPV